MSPLTFSKDERLKSRKAIAALFRGGNSFVAYPLRVVWLPGAPTAHSPVQLGISVPRRQFKTAVLRNRIKRMVREAYRLHKPDLYRRLDELGLPPVSLMLIYIGPEAPAFADLESAMKKMIRKFG